MIELLDVSCGYGADDVLRGLSLRLEPGKLTCLVGPNGSGKSTVLSLLNGRLRPSRGQVLVDGVPSCELPPMRSLRRSMGLVRQDPQSQLVASTVAEEVAFGPRNLGIEPQEVRSRVQGALEAAGLTGLKARAVESLSGGELQRLALAGVLAMRPRWVALDEVTASLDELSRARVRTTVLGLRKRGTGLVWATHFAREAALADSIVCLDEGAALWQGAPEEFFGDGSLLGRSGLGDDPDAPVAQGFVERGLPLSILSSTLEAAAVAREAGIEVPDAPLSSGDKPLHAASEPEGLQARSVTVATGGWRARRRLLDAVDLCAAPGTVTLVCGASGSGKTTLARVLAGVLEPDGGTARLGGAPVHAGMVGLGFQRAADQLFAPTVRDDVAFGPRALGFSEKAAQTASEEALEAAGLSRGLWERSPFSLSGGEARRAALAGVLACRPGAYVFDEPTAALDGPGRAFVRAAVTGLAGQGAPVVVTSHDLDEWLGCADSVVLMAGGSVVWQGEPGRLGLAELERAGLAPTLRQAVDWSEAARGRRAGMAGSARERGGEARG